MAQVKSGSQLREWIDDYLAYLLREWQNLPDLAQEWDCWTADEQLDFVVEWPIREDRLQQLQHWAAEGRLTPAQCARYQDLLALIARYRSTLERLFVE